MAGQSVPAPKALDLTASIVGGTVLLNKDGFIYEMPLSALMQKFDLAAEDGLSQIGRCATVANLRKMEPKTPGQRIDIAEYAPGSKNGGGYFFYDADDKTSKDDGGFCIVTPKGARWKRDIGHIGALNVTHFGAIPDGKTDCIDAVNKMWAFSKANLIQLGIQFPSGKFFLSKFAQASEVGYFRVVGFNSTNAFGYFNTTTIYSDDQDEFVFDVNARRTEISGIEFNGQIDLGNKQYRCSKKGFFRNVDPGGQYIRVSNFMSSWVGGTSFDMLDNLDTKFDQFYASRCTGTVLKGRPSFRDAGGWNHLTAIELTNFNMQYCTGNLVFDLPRATQSLIRNGWIEHCEFPGNLSDGQWQIDSFSMEDCDNPMQVQNARLVRFATNLQGKSNWDANSGESGWKEISAYEYGMTDIHNHGIKTDGSVQAGYYGSLVKMDNNTGAAQWFNACWVKPVSIGDTIQLRMFGTLAYSGNKIDNDVIGGGRQSGGYADVFIKVLQDSSLAIQWDGVGSCPILDVRSDNSKGSTNIYVKVAAWSRNVGVECYTTSKTRFEAGIRFQIQRKGVKVDEAAITGDAFPTVPTGMTLGTKNGIGWNGQGDLLMKFELQNGYLPVKIQSPSSGKITQGYIKVETSLPK